MFMIDFLTTKEEKDEVQKIFDELDVNHDGVLSYEELLTGYKKILSEEDAMMQVKQIFKQCDVDNNCKI